jgi:hypothetical protein
MFCKKNALKKYCELSPDFFFVVLLVQSMLWATAVSVRTLTSSNETWSSCFVRNVTRCLWLTTVVISTYFQMSNHADHINYIGISWNDESLPKSCDIQQDKYEMVIFIYES